MDLLDSFWTEVFKTVVVRHWNVTARVKRTKENEEKKTENQKLIRRESKVRHDLTFINPDAKRDGEDSVWRRLGPGTDRVRLGADTPTLRATPRRCVRVGNTGLD